MQPKIGTIVLFRPDDPKPDWAAGADELPAIVLKPLDASHLDLSVFTFSLTQPVVVARRVPYGIGVRQWHPSDQGDK
jgi:hypothetical protein